MCWIDAKLPSKEALEKDIKSMSDLILLQYVVINVIIKDEVVKHTFVVHRKCFQKKHILDLESYGVPQKKLKGVSLLMCSRHKWCSYDIEIWYLNSDNEVLISLKWVSLLVICYLFCFLSYSKQFWFTVAYWLSLQTLELACLCMILSFLNF